ncbi:MAG TPA: ATP-dependent DNA ligase [Gaiellaceae bacterium]|nr:ATP-dependent DNA ligase [Gaiellaceae bacterium]
MPLPLRPPVPPMLAKLVRELPRGEYLYEPKWDGFRCLAFRDGDTIELQSRHGNPLGRYFPEVVEALARHPAATMALDGELVIVTRAGFSFEALLARIHPAASRVERLRSETPAAFVAFDVLATEELLLDVPLAERRAELERLLGDAEPPLHLTPATHDPDVAAGWLERFSGAGIDGVVAKPLASPYEPGARRMLKVKHELTADCVVAGFRVYADRHELSSLLLGLHDEEGALQHVGVVTGLGARLRHELRDALRPLTTTLAGHPWERGFLLGGGSTGRLRGAAGRWEPGMTQDWVPVAPVRVAEVAYTQVDGHRFRHPARFRRWRPDRDPASCGVEQLGAAGARPQELLA